MFPQMYYHPFSIIPHAILAFDLHPSSSPYSFTLQHPFSHSSQASSSLPFTPTHLIPLQSLPFSFFLCHYYYYTPQSRPIPSHLPLLNINTCVYVKLHPCSFHFPVSISYLTSSFFSCTRPCHSPPSFVMSSSWPGPAQFQPP